MENMMNSVIVGFVDGKMVEIVSCIVSGTDEFLNKRRFAIIVGDVLYKYEFLQFQTCLRVARSAIRFGINMVSDWEKLV